MRPGAFLLIHRNLILAPCFPVMTTHDQRLPEKSKTVPGTGGSKIFFVFFNFFAFSGLRRGTPLFMPVKWGFFRIRFSSLCSADVQKAPEYGLFCFLRGSAAELLRFLFFCSRAGCKDRGKPAAGRRRRREKGGKRDKSMKKTPPDGTRERRKERRITDKPNYPPKGV